VKRDAGFSLIELLAVLGPVVLLVALLLPALGSAREAGRQVACLSNLRQIRIALEAHRVGHKEQFPLTASAMDARGQNIQDGSRQTNVASTWFTSLDTYCNSRASTTSPNLKTSIRAPLGRVALP
jgi:type II secretory pathway pseudopilin PulG